MEKELNKIIKGCQAGKARYQKALYETYYGRMLSVCLRYSKGQEEARDILQEGFIKVFKHIKNYQAIGSFEGWMRRIIVNTAINHFHRNRKYRANTSVEDEYHDLVDSRETPEYIIGKMSYEELLHLIRQLPETYRKIFNLYVIEGYTHREIAELLNISEGTSKSGLARARQRLQRRLGASEMVAA